MKYQRDNHPPFKMLVEFVRQSENEDAENLDLSTHLQSCPICYQKSLLIRLNQHQEGLTDNMQLPLNKVAEVKSSLGMSRQAVSKKQRASKKKVIWLSSSIAAAAALVLVSIFTIPLFQTQLPVTKAQAFLTFTKGRVLVNGKKGVTGDHLAQADVIETKGKSMAVIQIDTGALLSLREKSKVALEKILISPEKKAAIISQTKGISIHKIRPGKIDYQVKVPTAVAGVRGTLFSITYKKGRGSIKLLKGKVAAYPIKDGRILKNKELILTKKRKIKISKKSKFSKAKKISRKETKLLKTFDKYVGFTPVAEVESGNSESLVKIKVDKKAVKVLAKGTKKKKTIPEAKSLAALNKKYGKLYTVKTKKGETIIGAVIEQGSKYLIITPKASFEIAKDKVISKQTLPQIFNK